MTDWRKSYNRIENILKFTTLLHKDQTQNGDEIKKFPEKTHKTSVNVERHEFEHTNTMTNRGLGAAETPQIKLTQKTESMKMEEMFARFLERQTEREKIQEEERKQQELRISALETMFVRFIEEQREKDERMRTELKCLKLEVNKIYALTTRVNNSYQEQLETESRDKVGVMKTNVIAIEKEINSLEEIISEKINDKVEVVKTEILHIFKEKEDLRKLEFQKDMVWWSEAVSNDIGDETVRRINYLAQETDKKCEAVYTILKEDLQEHKQNVETRLGEIPTKVNISQIPTVMPCSGYDVKPPTFEGKENENPLRYLEAMKNYFVFHPHIGELEKALIAGFHMRGRAKVWWLDIQTEILTFTAFEEKFKRKFWNERRQDEVRNNLLSGKYVPCENLTKEEYARHIIRDVIYLDIPFPEFDVVRHVLKHFNEETQIWARMKEVRTFNKLYELLENLSPNEPSEIKSETVDEPFRDEYYRNKRGTNRGRYNFHKDNNKRNFTEKHQEGRHEGPTGSNRKRFPQIEQQFENSRNITNWKQEVQQWQARKSNFFEKTSDEKEENYLKRVTHEKNSLRTERQWHRKRKHPPTHIDRHTYTNISQTDT